LASDQKAWNRVDNPIGDCTHEETFAKRSRTAFDTILHGYSHPLYPSYYRLRGQVT